MSAQHRDRTVVLDRDGDAWRLRGGVWHCAAPADDVIAGQPVTTGMLEELGPLLVIYTPEDERRG